MSGTSSHASESVTKGKEATAIARAPWFILFTAVSLVLFAGSYEFYRVEIDRVRAEKYESIAAIATVKANQIKNWRLDRLADVQSLANGPMLRTALVRWLASRDDSGLKQTIEERLVAEGRFASCTNVLITGTDGHILFAARPESGTLDSATKQVIKSALSRGSATLSDLYRSRKGSVQIDAAEQITGTTGQPIAVAVFQFSAETLLYPLIQSWPTSSPTAETLLIRKDGESVLFLNELRHQANTALSLRVSLSGNRIPAVQAVLGESGTFFGKDYRGHEVLADLRSIPGSPWFMVAKVDASEIMQEVSYRGWLTALFCGICILLTAAVVALEYRRKHAQLYLGLYRMEQVQREAQKLFRTTLYSIGDAVIATDLEGLVQHMNPVAEKLTGWTEREAKGKTVDEIFRVFNEESHTRAENPVTRILRDRGVTGLANHTLLLSKDGIEHPIADSGAPIVDDTGATLGVVIVFRDQTEEREARRRLEEKEHLLQETGRMARVGGWEIRADTSEVRWTEETYRIHEVPLSYRPVIDEAINFFHSEDRAKLTSAIQDALAYGTPYDMEIRFITATGNQLWTRTICKPVIVEGKVVRLTGTFQDISDRKQAELDLKQSEERLRIALHAAKAGIWEWDLQTNEDFWSDELWALYELEPHCCRASHETWLGTIHPDDREQVAQTVSQAVDKGIEMKAEWRTNDNKGEHRWLMSRGRPIRDESGRVLRYIGIVIDITDRKRGEEIIRESEKHHRWLIDNLQAGVVVHAPDMRIVLCNRVAAQVFGLTPNEMKGKTPLDLDWSFIREDGSPMPVEEYAVSKVAATLEPITNLVVGMQRPGTSQTGWGLVNAYPALTEHNTLEQIVITFVDITGRKRAEESLRRSERRYRQLHETMRDAFVQADMSGLIVDFNAAYQEMLGYEADELRRLTYPEFTPAKWHDFEARIVSEEILPLGRSAVYEKEYVRKDGTVFPVELRTSMITDEGGKPSGMWAIVRDITNRKQEEAALKERERKFRLLYEEAPVPYQSLDEDGLLLEVNAAWLQLLGYSRDEVLGRSFADFLTPRSSQRFMQTFPAFKSVGYVHAVEHEMMCKDQSIIDVSIDGRIASSDQGTFSHTHCVFQDITQRKRAEKALLESEQRYRAIFNTAQVGIDLLDRHGRFLEVNSTLCQFLQYTSAELQNLCIPDVTHPEDIEKSQGLFDSLVQGKTEEFRLEKRYVRKDGAILWADLAVSAIRDADGGYRATVGVIRDITEYKKSEEARVRLEAAVEHAAETVEITDRQGIIVYVNPCFERTTGYSREEAIGCNPRILQSGHHDKAFYQRMWNTIIKGNIWTGHFINKKKDGTLFEEDVSISPVRNDSGDIIYYVAVKRDVTREVSLQGQLLQAQKMEAIGTLAGGIAHDFNNILQITYGYSELILGDEDFPSHFRADLQKIHESSRRGADLVDRLLMFSRKTDIRPQPLNLNRRIAELRKMLGRTIPKMIDIQLVLGQNLATINADPTQIDQVLMNLAVNARDAMPDGGRLVIETANVFLDEEYARTHLEAKVGPCVLLTVTDTGSGMDRDTVEHIFEPFYTTKAVGEGTGLGLAVVHGIVSQHHGQIRCYSEPGHGTTFQIHLPALQSPEHDGQKTIEPMPKGGTETILLVDDEELIRDLGTRILTKAGYSVLTASNGNEALKVYQEQSDEIALVILDLIMPEMGGKQCLEEFLALNASIKVVIASGYSADGPVREAIATGAKGFVNKPYDIRQMLRLIREVLDTESNAVS